MNPITQTIIAGLIVLLIGYPLVVAFDKWKKQMDAEEKKEKEEKDDVQN